MTAYLFNVNIRHYLNTFQIKTDEYCVQVKGGCSEEKHKHNICLDKMFVLQVLEK
jgi:hypothetical protein